MSDQPPLKPKVGRSAASKAAEGSAFAQSGGELALFQQMFHASPVPQCAVRLVDGGVLAVNEAWARITGVSCATALSSGLSAFGESFSEALAGVLAVAPGESPRMGECQLLASNGQTRTARLQVTEVANPNDNVRLLVLVVEEELGPDVPIAGPTKLATDIDEVKLLLQQQVQMHPAIEKLARVGHWTNAQTDQNVIWSPGLYTIAGLDPRAVIPRSEGRSGIHPDDLPGWHAAREALDGREVLYRWTRPNGTMRWLRSRMGRTSVAGQITVDFGVVQDVTDEVEAKTELGRQLAFVNSIATHVPGAIYKARRDPNGVATVSFLSPSASEVLEVKAEEVMADQRLFFQHIHLDDLGAVLTALDRAAQDLSAVKLSFRANLPVRGQRWIQAEASTQREADGSVVWHGFLTDVTASLIAAKSLARQHRMLQAVQKSQAAFIEMEDKRKAFDGLLASFLNVTDSEFGFVGEVLFDENDLPYARMQAISNIAWDEATHKEFNDSKLAGMEFRGINTLFGHALLTGEAVISNDPANDPRSGGLPHGHPELKSFLGIPIGLNGRLVALVGLANRPEGFDSSEVEFLQPLLGTVRELVMASQALAERRRVRQQFQVTSDLLAEKSEALQITFDSINQGLAMVDASGRLRAYNQRLLDLLDLPASMFVEPPSLDDILKFQLERGDFGPQLEALPPEVRPYVLRQTKVGMEKYVRRAPDGRMLEVFTRNLPDGGFVRTYTDVTSYFDTQEALREERQRLQWVLEATRPGIWEVNIATKETNFSERWAEMLGYTSHEMGPTTVLTWKRLIHPDDLPRALHNLKLHLSGDAAYYECDLRMRHKTGKWLWVNDRGRVHRRDSEGKALYMSGTLLDIHDRVAAQEEVDSLNASLERRVAERTVELERSMKDMETISYSIAHDLRAPLRSVNGFASVIAEDSSGDMSPEVKHMFERISRASRNMGQMITDMLELLRVVRVDLVTVPVDLNQLAHAVSDALAPSAPHALIGIKRLPPVMGDATLLKQVLVNLMDNALKYARHQAQPELVLGFDERLRAFYLRDNGRGFDMAHAGKLFGLFQRMHSDSEMPGTGVGLAIVARIIERHGGRIWAEAMPGKGATFWWTLPRA